MKKKSNNFYKKITSDKLLSGSALIFVASLGVNVMNYLFQLLMGRFLTPAEYGVLTSLFSLSYLTGVPGSTLITTATKFASKYKAREDFKAVTHSLVWSTKIVAVFGLFVFGAAVLFKNQIAGFLKISDSLLVVFFFLSIFISLLGSAPSGFLRGLLRFKAFSFVSLFTTFLKLVLGVGFVLLGWGVFGAVGGLVCSSFLGLFAAVALLRKNLRWPFEKNSFSPRDILSYAAPTVFVLLSFQALYNTDVILVKHFFSSHQAGIYSSVVTLGRIIFFGLSSVGLVMFPMVSEKMEAKENFKGIFVKSLLLVFAGALTACFVYSVFPSLLVNTLFGSAYKAAVPYLGNFALFMGIFSLLNLFVQFFLSVRDFRFLPVLCAGALVQAGLIWQFHANLYHVIYVNIGVSALTLFGLIVFYVADFTRALKAESENSK